MMNIRNLADRGVDLLLRSHAAGRWLLRQWQLALYTYRGFRRHNTLTLSAALTFYTLVSLVPVLAVVFAVMKGFGLPERLLGELYGLFPQHPETVDYLVSFAGNALARTQGGLMAAVALAMLFWSVAGVFRSIESAFNNIWEVRTERGWARQMPVYLSILVLMPVLWFIAGALGSYARELLGFDDRWFFVVLSKAASLAVLWTMFALFYFVVPNTQVRFVCALKAGIAAGTVFFLFQWIFLFAQRWVTSYNAVYGSFAALPLLLLWLRYSWLILLAGGDLSFTFQHIERFCEEGRTRDASYDTLRRAMLAAMLVVVRDFRDRRGPVTADAIGRRLHLPGRLVAEALQRLVAARQLVVEQQPGDFCSGDAYVPGYDIAAMRICDVLAAVETFEPAAGPAAPAFDFGAAPELERAAQALDLLKDEAGRSSANVKLIDLL